MKRKIRFFRQHSLETCGISCVLMILDCFGKVQYPTAKQERKLYAIFRCRAFKGTLAPAIADCLSANRLNTAVYHSSPRYMENRNAYYEEPLYAAILDEYTKTVQKIADRVEIQTNCNFTPDWYRQQLDQEKLLMVQCIVPGNADGVHEETLHWILVYDYDGQDFLVCDPLSSKIRLTEAEMDRYTDTPIGKICVTAAEKTTA